MNRILEKYSPSLVNKAKTIKAMISDVDGVLTDGKVSYTSDGVEIKSFNVKDGLIVKKLRDSGIIVGFITGRSSSIVEKRSNELGLDFCYQGSTNKMEQYEKIKQDFSLIDEEIAYLGDDVNDLSLIIRSGLGIAPADTMEYIKDKADLITKKTGGEGVFREAADLILASKGKLDKFFGL
jgi:3-deoxy-D-manno-octulosonate 8-phosphate phosphatase (KDO 8-P phosphatase)